MNQIDLSFFLEPPQLTVSGILAVEALAPLSMVTAQPGVYYRSQPMPTPFMLYGLLENVLGWHVGDKMRKEIITQLRKKAKKLHGKQEVWKDSDWLKGTLVSSGVDYLPLLQYHVKFGRPLSIPAVTSYDDLWSQHLRDTGRSFFGGSRRYDASLEKLMTRARQGEITFGDHKEFKMLEGEALENAPAESKINYKAVRDRFPQYFVSLPTMREYVLPQGPYSFKVETTATVADLLKEAFANPAAPLYLGSNDGWVEVTWEEQP